MDLPILRQDFPEFSWEESGICATAEEKALAFIAASEKGACADFHRNVWNEMVKLLSMAFEEAGMIWDDADGAPEQIIMSGKYESLTAKRFNSLIKNIDAIAKTGWKWVFQKGIDGYVGRDHFYGVTERGNEADILYGWYMIEIARKVNLIIRIMKNTADFSDAVTHKNITFALTENFHFDDSAAAYIALEKIIAFRERLLSAGSSAAYGSIHIPIDAKRNIRAAPTEGISKEFEHFLQSINRMTALPSSVMQMLLRLAMKIDGVVIASEGIRYVAKNDLSLHIAAATNAAIVKRLEIKRQNELVQSMLMLAAKVISSKTGSKINAIADAGLHIADAGQIPMKQEISIKGSVDMVSVILDRYRLQRAIDLDQRANLVYADTIRYGVCIASNVKNQSIARAADTIINDAEKKIFLSMFADAVEGRSLELPISKGIFLEDGSHASIAESVYAASETAITFAEDASAVNADTLILSTNTAVRTDDAIDVIFEKTKVTAIKNGSDFETGAFLTNGIVSKLQWNAEENIFGKLSVEAIRSHIYEIAADGLLLGNAFANVSEGIRAMAKAEAAASGNIEILSGITNQVPVGNVLHITECVYAQKGKISGNTIAQEVFMEVSTNAVEGRSLEMPILKGTFLEDGSHASIAESAYAASETAIAHENEIAVRDSSSKKTLMISSQYIKDKCSLLEGCPTASDVEASICFSKEISVKSGEKAVSEICEKIVTAEKMAIERSRIDPAEACRTIQTSFEVSARANPVRDGLEEEIITPYKADVTALETVSAGSEVAFQLNLKAIANANAKTKTAQLESQAFETESDAELSLGVYHYIAEHEIEQSYRFEDHCKLRMEREIWLYPYEYDNGKWIITQVLDAEQNGTCLIIT